MTASEIKQVLDKVKNDITFYSFALLALNTGARGRSVMNIKKSDIKEDGRVTIKDFKNNSTYNGFLSEEVILLLKLNDLDSNSYVVSRENRENKESDYTELTKYFQKNIFHDLFNKNLAEHDIKNRVVVHTFRHTFGSQLANNDTDVYVIKELMNHSDIKSTIRYAKLRDETLRQKAIQLNFS
ncbi:MAG: site-specific integrase [Candidatus Staskawiczbacteria bacterium]|nr:site-specific integrase [Candidatus Staskawiczbacteria bacterium]